MTSTKKLTYTEWKKRKTRREMNHPVCVDNDARERYDRAVRAVAQAKGRLNNADALAEAEAELAAATEAVQSATVLLRLRALPRLGEGSFAALKAEHPPQDKDHEQQRDYQQNPKARAVWHTDTFAPALVAASLIEPEMTLEQAAEEAREMNEGEWAELYGAALAVNQQSTTTDGLTFR